MSDHSHDHNSDQAPPYVALNVDMSDDDALKNAVEVTRNAVEIQQKVMRMEELQGQVYDLRVQRDWSGAATDEEKELVGEIEGLRTDVYRGFAKLTPPTVEVPVEVPPSVENPPEEDPEIVNQRLAEESERLAEEGAREWEERKKIPVPVPDFRQENEGPEDYTDLSAEPAVEEIHNDGDLTFDDHVKEETAFVGE